MSIEKYSYFKITDGGAVERHSNGESAVLTKSSATEADPKIHEAVLGSLLQIYLPRWVTMRGRFTCDLRVLCQALLKLK